jgi:TetR/AcrR family transcriptional regulator
MPADKVDPRKRRTMDALLAAAGAVFSEQPADEVTVEQIAARAGVAVGSIYNHFGSKAGLHTALVDRALGLEGSYMDRAYTPDRSPAEQIAAAGAEYYRFYLEHPDYFRIAAFPPPPGQYAAARETAERIAQRVDSQIRRLADTLRRAIAAGEARDVDPDEVATVIWAAWNGIISLAWRPDAHHREEQQLHALLATATDLVARGILRAPPS